MRLPRPRFTLRWLMVAVAIAGLLIGGTTLWQRRAHYLTLALQNAVAEKHFEDEVEHLMKQIGRARPEMTEVQDMRFPPEDERTSSIRGRVADWMRASARFAALRIKYEYAARYPWLPVAPDPPEPE